jgi:hypothetical protein
LPDECGRFDDPHDIKKVGQPRTESPDKHSTSRLTTLRKVLLNSVLDIFTLGSCHEHKPPRARIAVFVGLGYRMGGYGVAEPTA